MNNCKKETCPLVGSNKKFEVDYNWLDVLKEVKFEDRHILSFMKKNKKVEDYEAYDTMHSNDGIVGKSVCSRRL